MKIEIQFNIRSDSYILKFIYAGIQVLAPLEKQSDSSLKADLQEKTLTALMNLCIQELQDIKRQKVIKHEADEGKVKFFGVDYS